MSFMSEDKALPKAEMNETETQTYSQQCFCGKDLLGKMTKFACLKEEVS